MSIVDAKYDRLAARRSYLRDVAVLAQAWKKTQAYIRRYNWYADTLELDCSAARLDERLSEWSAAIASGAYQPAPAWLVPAPKSGLWSFSSKGKWAPHVREEDGDAPVLRPLAHLGIREQTVATAVMLCIADCIESAQGDTSLSPEKAARQGVYSYGNRLFCNWTESSTQARFSWGNSNTYSRYFQDYQRFVERPNTLALSAEASKADDEVVYIAKLDITAFFDNIDVERLVRGLEDEYASFVKHDSRYRESDRSFWKIARSALRFRWREEDLELAGLFRDRALPRGLPQGLVSSGFFANAYLLPFDRAVGKAIGRVIHRDYELRIHDYCRYVDDLRLVISVRGESDEEIDEAALARDLCSWIDGKLKKWTSSAIDPQRFLRLNSGKTELERLGDVGGESRTAARMKSLQNQLSGPFDLETLHQVEAGLSGLLSLAELGLIDDASSPSDQSLRLASVAKTKLEVRDDTLTRFSAYRLTRSLRMRRSMTDLTESTEEGSVKDALLHDFEAAARRLVAAWAVNPSLVQVLRYALDLFPSAELLEPISQALTSKLHGGGATDYEERVVFYVLAELFKAGAMETGHRAERDLAFPVGDVTGYRVSLASLAQNVLELPELPWYVQQQASLLLAAVGLSTTALGRGPELKFHRALNAFVKGQRSDVDLTAIDEVTVSLVGHQLLGDTTRYAAWFRKFAFARGRPIISSALRLIGETAPDLFARIVRPPRDTDARSPASFAPKYLMRYAATSWARGWEPLPNLWMPLATAMTHPSAPFGQENALLRLALLLADSREVRDASSELLSPLNIEVRCTAWAEINDPRFEGLQLRLSKTSRAYDPVYATPAWCRPKDAWMYAIGRVLRSAATGEPDFTVRQWLFREDPGWYRGIRSTWQQRRIGMLHTPEALRGTAAAITPWLSGLLLGLLRWPGISQRERVPLDGVTSLRELASLLRSRLEMQRQIYGSSSNLAVYRYPIDWPIDRERGLRVVMVQGLMPVQDDFRHGLDGLEVAGYRERHRNHTAALLHLVNRHLSARDYVLGPAGKPRVDLVIFPEFSVHIDDQDLMRAFSDATGAMLFYGLLGARAPGTLDPINTGRWLVPRRTAGRRSWIEVDQGKWHLTREEQALGVKPWRPYQVVIELQSEGDVKPFRISGSICYDATDLSLAADLRDESHMYVIAAMNKDVKTFDGMVAALKYHMYQHVLIANIGEFGGSTAQAPYDLEHRRLIAHSHGAEQIAISVFDVRMDDFGPNLDAAKDGTPTVKTVTQRIGKTPPAGLSR